MLSPLLGELVAHRQSGLATATTTVAICSHIANLAGRTRLTQLCC
jgi:hypothetical protein